MSARLRWAVARLVFVVAALVGAWWGLRGRWGEVQDALAQVHPASLLAALAITCVGLLGTAAVWRTILSGFGARVPPARAASIFFVGQLGKYIPGSVWSIGAQAHAATRLGVVPRTTAACSLVFLHVHVATGAVPVCLLVLLGALSLSGPSLLWAAVLLLALALVSPWALARLGGMLAGRALVVKPRQWVQIAAGMALAWLAYGAAATFIAPADAGFWPVLGAFAAAYVVGVLVVFAPAGLGAREAVMIALLAPTLGVGAAAAVTLMVRVVHTMGDLLMALGAAASTRWWEARHAVLTGRLP